MTATNSNERTKAPLYKRPATILVAISAYAFVSAGVLSLWDALPPAVRIPLAVPLLLFVPGFAITYVIFPPRKDQADVLADNRSIKAPVTVLERTTVAVVVSIAVVPAVTYVLNPVFGVSLGPSLLGVAIVTLLSSAGGIYRAPSDAATVGDQAGAESRRLRDSLRSLADPLTIVAIVLSAALVGTGAVVALSADEEHSPETEFYIADGASAPATEGGAASYELTITQHGMETQDYTVVVLTDDRSGTDQSQSLSEVSQFETAVPPGESVTETVSASAPAGEAETTYLFLLYTGDAPADPDRGSAHRVLQHTPDVSE